MNPQHGGAADGAHTAISHIPVEKKILQWEGASSKPPQEHSHFGRDITPYNVDHSF
jgi:hypothetical protein